MSAVDDRGTTINVGDTVAVLYVDRGRGAQLWMGTGRVVGFGPSRVVVQFPSRTTPQRIGAECLRVVAS